MQTKTVKYKLPDDIEKAAKWLFKNRNPKGVPRDLIQQEIDNAYNLTKQRGVIQNQIIVGTYQTR